MSTLIELLRDDIDKALGRKGEKLLNMVEVYGGEFTSAEVMQHGTASPVCLIACLGWTPSSNKRISNARSVRFGFFVMTKGAKRAERMLQAISICERLSGYLQDWKPSELSECVDKFEEPTAENLYSRATDTKGLGLWLVRASIDVSYCKQRFPVAQYGSVEAYMNTLIAPTYTIESDALTTATEPLNEVTQPQIENTLHLNNQTIGVNDDTTTN